MHNPGTGCLLILGLIICAAIGLAIETIWGKLLLACSVVVLLIGWFYHHPKLRGNEQNQRIVAVWLAGMLILAGGMIGYAHLGDKQQAEKIAHPKQEAQKMDYEGYIQNHFPHDGRHTCKTRLDNAGVNPTTAKLILGHSSNDVEERVYTHKTTKQLIEAINLI